MSDPPVTPPAVLVLDWVRVSDTGSWAAVIALTCAIVVGLAHRLTQGRIRRVTATGIVPRRLREAAAASGVTLVQFSSITCTACRQARGVLTGLVEAEPGLSHVEFDLTDEPELADQLRIRGLPTTIAVDPGGRELFRMTGVPRPAELMAALPRFPDTG